jgi:hypothetical protein
MFWPLHDHHHEGCIQWNTKAANSVEDVYMCVEKVQYYQLKLLQMFKI